MLFIYFGLKNSNKYASRYSATGYPLMLSKMHTIPMIAGTADNFNNNMRIQQTIAYSALRIFCVSVGPPYKEKIKTGPVVVEYE